MEFKLYLIKEFQRLKDQERKQLGWDIRRNLTKINYRIHTDAIKENLIPLSKGIDISPKYIPAEVFDKRAVEKNQVVFQTPHRGSFR